LGGHRVIAVGLRCGTYDALLMEAGVTGFGPSVSALPWLPTAMTRGGAAFLVINGALRFRAAWTGTSALSEGEKGGALWATLGTAAALTWLNPHVYLDTLGLIGAISTTYTDVPTKTAFGVAAVAASFVFFFSLGYGARRLAPIMASPRAWSVLDFGIGATMWVLAAGLLLSLH